MQKLNKPKPIEPWITIAVAEGMQRLLCLSLDRTPAEAIIKGTAAVWVQAIWPGRDWDEASDAPRIHEAFRRIAAELDHWPSVPEFLARLPRRREARGLMLAHQRGSDDERRRGMTDVGTVLGDLNLRGPQ